MKYDYNPVGVCPKKISFEVEDGFVKNVCFHGGCNGNGKGIATLVDGMKVDDVIEKLNGITCAARKTSCPAQLAEALKNTKK